MAEDERTFLCGFQRQRRYGTTTTPTSSKAQYSSYIHHTVDPSDTLQGLALRYGVSMTEIKRLNKLWSPESLHLKDILVIPVYGSGTEVKSYSNGDASTPSESPSSSISHPPPAADDEPSVSDFLSRIDSTIRNTARYAQKLQRESTIDDLCPPEGMLSRDGSSQSFTTPVVSNRSSSPTSVTTGGRKELRRSLKNFKDAHDRFFQL